jgi:TM2 domain-containing membrane protein YozV
MSETEIKIVGYCRICGTGLDEANIRTANGTIYCAEHVPPAAEQAPPPPRNDTAYSPYTAPAAPPGGSSDASPGAAFVLGLIPGVGAIYNGQYAKGIVHVVIVALLIMAADNSSDGAGTLFGMLIPAFWFYMAFEAYHTARRRREGLPVDEFSSLGMASEKSGAPIAAILLIVFGAVFLMNNLGFFEIRQLMRFWPVGMIGLGLYLLFVRMKGDNHEPK